MWLRRSKSDRSRTSSAEADRNRAVVRRLVDEVMSRRRLDVIDELYVPELAASARRWIAPFLGSFTDLEIRIDRLVAEGDTVVGRFSCSGTQTGRWRGHEPTGRRFVGVAEVYFFEFRDGRICGAWGLEDNLSRERQLRERPACG